MGQVEPTLPAFVKGDDPVLVVNYASNYEYYLNNYSESYQVSTPRIEQATFRIVPLDLEDDITFGEYYPVEEDFPKRIVEKSVPIDTDSNDNYISSPNIGEFSTSLNFRPDVYNHDEAFPSDLSENGDIYDVLEDETDKKSADVIRDSYKYQPENKYQPELFRKGKETPQYNILVIPENKNQDVVSSLSLEESLPPTQFYFKPSKPMLDTTFLPKKQQKESEDLINFSQPADYIQEQPIHLPSQIHEPQFRDNNPPKLNNDYNSYNKDEKDSPTYSYTYSVNGGPYGPQFAKHEKRSGHLTRGEYSVALPDGRIQTVRYTVLGDKGGFSATVHYAGKGRHPQQNTNQFARKSSQNLKYYEQESQERFGDETNQNLKSVKYIPHRAFQG